MGTEGRGEQEWEGARPPAWLVVYMNELTGPVGRTVGRSVDLIFLLVRMTSFNNVTRYTRTHSR